MASETLNFGLFAKDNASRTLDKFGRTVDQTDDKFSRVGRTMAAVGKIAAVGLAAGVGVGVVALKKFVGDARESERVTKLTEAVIKSTGGAAKVSAGQVAALSTAISNKTGVDDEAIQTGSNLLLTFKNIRNEAGKGNKVFNEATQAAVDLSAAGFGSIESSSKMLGKALNDPVKGITALGRAGVTFTDQQKKQIEQWVKHGDVLKAQNAILGEVQSQVGGAAAATGTATDKLKVTLGNLSEQLGTKLLPYVDKAASKFREFIGEMQSGTGRGGEFATKLRELGAFLQTEVLPRLREFGTFLLTTVIPALTSMGGSLSSTAIPLLTTLAHVITPLVQAFAGMPGAVQLAALAFVALGRGAAGAGTHVSGLATTMRTNFAEGGAIGVMRGGLRGLVGFMGGPWGIAFAAAGAILVNFAVKHAEAKARVDSLATSLDAATGAITRETRAQVVNTLEKSGALVAAQKLGINLRDVTSAALGNEGAQRRVNAALRGYTDELPQATGRTAAHTGANAGLSKAQREVADAAGKVGSAINNSSKEMDAARAKAGRTSEALAGLGAAAEAAGRNFASGLALGIRTGAPSAILEAEVMAGKVEAAVRRVHKTNSPSLVAIQLGQFFSEGVGIGIKDKTAVALDAVSDLASKITDKLKALRQSARDIAQGAAGAVRGMFDWGAIGATTTTPGGTDADGNALPDVSTTASPVAQFADFAAQSRAFAGAVSQGVAHGLDPRIVAQAVGTGNLTVVQSLAALDPASAGSVNRDFALAQKMAAQVSQTVLSTTSIPADIARQQNTLDTLKDIKRSLASGKIEFHIHDATDPDAVVAAIRRYIKKNGKLRDVAAD